MLAVVRAEEKLPVEQLHTDDGENELEQYVHDQNVDDILQRVDNAVEHRLQFRHTLDGFQRSQHAQHSQRLDGGEVLSHAALVAVAGTVLLGGREIVVVVRDARKTSGCRATGRYVPHVETKADCGAYHNHGIHYVPEFT